MIIQLIKDKIQRRSSKWQSVKNKHLLFYGKCSACGGIKNLEVHHIKPFHLFPDLELDPLNLLTLCESKKLGVHCHLLFGHLGKWSSYNLNVLEDSKTWLIKLNSRKQSAKI